MTDQLTEEEALEIIRTAFAPLRCVAERTDYLYYRFRVFNESDDGILKAPHLSEDDISTRKSLKEVLLMARSQINDQGYALNDWVIPGDQPSAA